MSNEDEKRRIAEIREWSNRMVLAGGPIGSLGLCVVYLLDKLGEREAELIAARAEIERLKSNTDKSDLWDDVTWCEDEDKEHEFSPDGVCMQCGSMK